MGVPRWETGLEAWDFAVVQLAKCFAKVSDPCGAKYPGRADPGTTLFFGNWRAEPPNPQPNPTTPTTRTTEAVDRRLGQHVLPFPHGPPCRSPADFLFLAGYGVRRTSAVQAWKAPTVVSFVDAETLEVSFGPLLHSGSEFRARHFVRAMPPRPALRGRRDAKDDSLLHRFSLAPPPPGCERGRFTFDGEPIPLPPTFLT